MWIISPDAGGRVLALAMSQEWVVDDAAGGPAPRAPLTERARRWALEHVTGLEGVGDQAPDHGGDAGHPLIVDLETTLATAHSDREWAAPTFKRRHSFHPLCVFVDHGPNGAGERWSSCCGPVVPDRTLPPTTSAWPAVPCASCLQAGAVLLGRVHAAR